MFERWTTSHQAKLANEFIKIQNVKFVHIMKLVEVRELFRKR